MVTNDNQALGTPLHGSTPSFDEKGLPASVQVAEGEQVDVDVACSIYKWRAKSMKFLRENQATGGRSSMPVLWTPGREVFGEARASTRRSPLKRPFDQARR